MSLLRGDPLELLGLSSVCTEFPSMDFDLANAMYEMPRKPKFEKDFIMLSEFSELVGPVPVVSYSSTSACMVSLDLQWWWVQRWSAVLV